MTHRRDRERSTELKLFQEHVRVQVLASASAGPEFRSLPVLVGARGEMATVGDSTLFVSRMVLVS